MKRIIFSLSALVASVVLVSCSYETVSSEDVAPSTIWRSVKMAYHAGPKKLVVLAQARVGGTTGTTVDYGEDQIPRLLGQPMKKITRSSFLSPTETPPPVQHDPIFQEHNRIVGVGRQYLTELMRFSETGTYYLATVEIEKPEHAYGIDWPGYGTVEIPLPTPVALELTDEGLRAVLDGKLEDTSLSLETLWLKRPHSDEREVHRASVGTEFLDRRRVFGREMGPDARGMSFFVTSEREISQAHQQDYRSEYFSAPVFLSGRDLPGAEPLNNPATGLDAFQKLDHSDPVSAGSQN